MCDGGLTRRPAAVVAILVALGAPARGEIIDVPADFATIQAAINAAEDGDVIVVAPGTYTGIGNRELDFGGRRITVQSADPQDPAVVASTVINCLQAGRAFFLHSGETTASVIDGLTVINGFATDGPGVYLLDGSGVTVRNCVFSGHTLPAASGVIQSDNFPNEPPADLAVFDCTIEGNTGGGIVSFSIESFTVTGCTISGNFGPGVSTGYFGAATAVVQDCLVADNGGEGIDLTAGTMVELSQCTVSGNGGTGVQVEGRFGSNGVEVSGCTIVSNASETIAGGMHCHADGGPALIRNCLIAGNTGPSAGGMAISGFGAFEITTSTFAGNAATEFGGGGIRAFGTEPTSIRSCILWGNTAPEGQQLLLASGFNSPAVVSVDFCDLEGGEAAVAVERGLFGSDLLFGGNNIDADPLFVDPGAGDYHLAAGSPAVDAGDPDFVAAAYETDLDGDPRVVGGRVDLGADEFRRPGDLDGDGLVDVGDLLALLGASGACPDPPSNCPADVNGDGLVGVVDLLALLSDWG